MPVQGRAAGLGIYLRPTEDASVRVGSLYRDPNGAVTFTVDQKYIALGPTRPILSLSWQESTEEGTKARLLHNGDKITQGAILPAFFENLLPEGALLDLVRKEFGAGAFDNFDVLRRLGHDLQGPWSLFRKPAKRRPQRQQSSKVATTSAKGSGSRSQASSSSSR